MESTENKTSTLTSIRIISEKWIDSYKGIWLMVAFFIFVACSWYLIYNLPFLFPGRIDIPYSYPPFSLTQGDYTIDIWYPKTITTNTEYPLIYTVSTTKTTKKQMNVNIDNILSNNTSVVSTPNFSHLIFPFSDEKGYQQQQIVNITLPDSGNLSPAKLDIKVTIKTPTGSSKSGNLKIPVAQVGWFKYLWQVGLLLISGLITILSNLYSGYTNIKSLLSNRKDIQN